MFSELLKEVLKTIKPTIGEHERVQAFVDELVRIARLVTGYECVVCGSIGKETWLHGDHDIDLFILFPDVFVSVPVEPSLFQASL